MSEVNHVPGTTPTCIEHGEKLAVVRNQVNQMSEDMRELAASVKSLVNFQTTIVAQLRMGAIVFALVQPLVTGMVLWFLQTHLAR